MALKREIHWERYHWTQNQKRICKKKHHLWVPDSLIWYIQRKKNLLREFQGGLLLHPTLIVEFLKKLKFQETELFWESSMLNMSLMEEFLDSDILIVFGNMLWEGLAQCFFVFFSRTNFYHHFRLLTWILCKKLGRGETILLHGLLEEDLTLAGVFQPLSERPYLDFILLHRRESGSWETFVTISRRVKHFWLQGCRFLNPLFLWFYKPFPI